MFSLADRILTRLPSRWRRLLTEGAIFLLIGLLMGMIQPYGSGAAPVLPRYVYWVTCILSGGMMGIACDRILRRRARLSLWPRVFVTTLLITPLISIIVSVSDRLMFGHVAEPSWIWASPIQVFAIALPVMAVHALIWRKPVPIIETRTIVETKTVIEPPLPTATETFRRRLSARHRAGRLIAVEAEDHYLRVYTDAGDELIAGRMSDTLDELAQAHGYQVHRSWWVAADAIEKVRWNRGSGEARLVGGLAVPISRRRADAIKLAGW